MSEQLIRPKALSFPTQETDLSLSELRYILRRKWKAAVGIAVLVSTCVVISTLMRTPKYQSETLILLNGQQTAPVAPGPESQQAYDYYYKNFSTEIQVLRSSSLVANALSRLKKTYSNLSVSQIRGNLSIRQAGDADILIVSYTDTDPERAKAVLEALGWIYVDYSLERQRSKAANAIDFIDEQLPEAQKELDETALAINHFRQHYGIVDPDVYAQKVSEFRQSLEQQAQEVMIAISRTQRQYEELRHQLAKTGQDPETALAYAVLSEDMIYQNLATQLREIESQYALERTRFHDTYPLVEDLRLQREEMQNLLRERAQEILGSAVSQVDLNQVLPVSGGGATQLNLASQGSPTSEAGATQSNLGNQVSSASRAGTTQQNLTNQLLQVETELAAQQGELKAIRQAEAEVAANFRRIPQIQQTYVELKRQLTAKSESVNYLLQRRQELEIAAAQEIAPWEILEFPYLPGAPISPDVRRNLLLGLIAGGLLGVGAALLLQRLDQRVKQVEEVKQLTQLPLLGAIPKVEQPFVRANADAEEHQNYQYSSFTEALRSLAMNLRYLITETGRIKVLALTSAGASEGKTTITYNLGIVLAQLGLRVLIVDADMRKPRIHKLLRQSNAVGLSTAIATERPWSELVQIGEEENLAVLTSGPKSPNPVALLDSARMKQLLEEWRQFYDYVLVDTPPIGVMADARSLVNQVDSVFLVAGIERVSRGAINHSMEVLRGSQCHLAGFVANFIDESHDYYAYSYYSYYHQSSLNGNGNGNGNGGEDPSQVEGKIQRFLAHLRRR